MSTNIDHMDSCCKGLPPRISWNRHYLQHSYWKNSEKLQYSTPDAMARDTQGCTATLWPLEGDISAMSQQVRRGTWWVGALEGMCL